MKIRETEFYGGLLVAAMALAWWSIHVPAEKKNQTEVKPIDLWKAQGALQSLAFDKERLALRIDGRWAQTERQRPAPKKKRPADAGPDWESLAEEAPTTEVRRFRINQKAQDLIASLTALKAKRNLGEVTPKTLADLGLEKPVSQLVLTFKDSEQRLQVGEKDVSGRLRYVQLQGQAPVYVVESRLIDDLEFADSRLMEVNLLSFDLAQVSAFTLKAGAQSHRWVRRGKEFAQDGKEEVDPKASTWITKFFRLKAISYVDPEQKDKDPQTPVAVFSIDLETKEDKETVSLSRLGEGKAALYHSVVGSEPTRIKVSSWTGKDLEDDVPELLGSPEPTGASQTP